MVTKADIRAEILKERKKLDKLEVKRKSFLICELAIEIIEKCKPESISLYLPYDNEVNTFPLAAYALFSGIKVFVPVAAYDSGKLYHAELTDLSRLTFDRRGIPVPEKFEKLISEKELEVEMVFCPGIAFDLNRARIGHGEGFYDKFLSELKDVLKVGLAFEFQIVDELPVEKHDVRMDYIVTEKRIIEQSS